jgi:hypothetical protein
MRALVYRSLAYGEDAARFLHTGLTARPADYSPDGLELRGMGGGNAIG